MFHILGFIFILIIAVLFIGLSIIGVIVGKVFSLGNGRRSSQNRPNNSYTSPHQANGNTGKAAAEEIETPSKRKKVFTDDMGEYVDFEEIKD